MSTPPKLQYRSMAHFTFTVVVGALSVDGRRLSVRLSVCPVTDPKSRTAEGRSKLKIGRKEGDP